MASQSSLLRGLVLVLAVIWAGFSVRASWTALQLPATRYGILALFLGITLGTLIAPLGTAVHFVVQRIPSRVFFALMALVSVGFSWWLWRGPMHGQVISGDACIYILQGRAAAHGSLAIPVTAPRLAHGAKFLFEGLDGRLHSVFVPGYGLFLAPFMKLGKPEFVGIVTGVILTGAQAWLGRVLAVEPFVWRVSLLLLLPCYARAIETADLLSHAWVGILDCLGLGLVLLLREKPTVLRAIGLGVCVGWVFCTRMLDGFVLAAVCSAGLIDRLFYRKFPAKLVLVGVLSALPFIALVALQQYEATGNWREATVLEYVRRADGPPGCLRLGFGPEVGCMVEHARERESFGPDGYTIDDAFRLVSERTGRLGTEILGLPILLLMAWLGVFMKPEPGAVVLSAFPVLLTLAYSFFYYGNSAVHGARHVFPAAPILAVLLARTVWILADWLSQKRGKAESVYRGALLLGIASLLVFTAPPLWRDGVRETSRRQEPRMPLRSILERNNLRRGLVVISDIHSYLADLSPWTDGPELIIVSDDFSGVRDLRRFHPELPTYLVLPPGVLAPVVSPVPAPGLHLEFEKTWPSFERTHRTVGVIVHTLECCSIAASGRRALSMLNAEEGSRYEVPFDLARSGQYRLRLNGLRRADFGRWQLSVDGRIFGEYNGFSEASGYLEGPLSEPVELTAGAHTFSAVCIGKDPNSHGYGATFDVLMALPAE